MIEVRTQNVNAYIYHQPKEGNVESGDTYFTYDGDGYFLIAIADGLGNGAAARESSKVILQVLERYHEEAIDDLMVRCNEQMLHKRGAAVALVKINYQSQMIEFSSIGNVKFYLLHKGDRMIYPLPIHGYLSGRPIKPNAQSFPYAKGDLFLLHSDGINLRSPRASLKNAKCLFHLYDEIISTSLENDDATFIVGNLL